MSIARFALIFCVRVSVSVRALKNHQQIMLNFQRAVLILSTPLLPGPEISPYLAGGRKVRILAGVEMEFRN